MAQVTSEEKAPPASIPNDTAPASKPNDKGQKQSPGVTQPPTQTVPSDESPAWKQRSLKARVAPDNQAVAQVKLMPGERSYLKTIAALDSTIKTNNDRPMRPALRADYERNLAVVNRALAATRNAAKNNPNDPDAKEFMFDAYQSKVDLLNAVADARSFNRQQ